MNPLLKRSDMARDSKGITQFYLPPTHEPYLPLLPSRRASPPFGWYSLRLPTEGWPGWVDLGDWLYTEIDFPRTGSWTPDTVTHLSTNRAWCRLTSLIETNLLTTTPNRQPVVSQASCWVLIILLLEPCQLYDHQLSTLKDTGRALVFIWTQCSTTVGLYEP